MANLSNINNKFLFTDGDFLKIGNLAPINNISGTESGISITNSNVASITLDNTAASGKRYVMYSSGNGSLVFWDGDATSARLQIDTSGNSIFAGNITGVRGFFNSGATNVVATFTSTDGTATLQCADPTGNVEFGASGNNFVVQPAGGVAQLTVGASSSTFAGSVNITGGTTNGLNITTSGTQNTIKIDRAATSDNAITKYQTASADKWIVGLRNTGDDNFRFYSYGTSTDVLTINQANGNVGIGVAPYSYSRLTTEGSDNTSSNYAFIAYQENTNAILACRNDGQVTIPSGNLGIGGIPTKKLTVNAGTTSGDGINITGSSSPAIYINETSGTVNSSFQNDGAGSYLGTSTSHPMIFRTANTERMRIDSSGNVFINGQTDNILGVNTSDGSDNKSITITSSAVASSNRGGYASFYGNEHATFAGNTFVVAGNTSGAELRLHAVNSSGIITAYTAGSERMRITSAGQVQVGYYNTARGGANTTFMTGKSGTTYLELNGGDTNGEGGILFADGSGGNYGLINYSHVSDIMQFYTASAERMRITSDGLLFVGDTNTNYGYLSHHIERDYSQGYALIVRNSNTTTQNNSVIQLNQAETTNTTQGYFLIGRQGDPNTGASRILIYSNGDIKNQNNSYGGISDERLKENIVDATPKLDELMKVKVRNFNLKGEETKQIGVVAQELEEVFPSMIDEAKKPDSEDETLYKSVKYSVFVPMLIKAIQELKADNDSLKARIETLENN